MKRKLFQVFSCLIVVASLLSSCSKEGPAGAQGPAGPAGPAGPTGATGTPGSTGATGTANVIYSAWLDVTYQTSISGTDTFFIATIPATKLDNTILNTGEIKVYFNLGSSTTPTIMPLPYVDVFSGLYIQPYFSLQSIQLESDANLSTRTSNGVKIYQCRYVLIPGGTNARTAINWNNYAEVKAYLGLMD